MPESPVSDIASVIESSITDYFRTELSMDLEISGKDDTIFEDNDRIIAAVQFSGAYTGKFSMHVSQSLSSRLAAAMLEAPQEEVSDEDVRDAVAGMCSAVCDQLRSRLVDSGLPCECSRPTTVTPDRYGDPDSDPGRATMLSFHHEGSPLVAVIALNPAEEDPEFSGTDRPEERLEGDPPPAAAHTTDEEKSDKKNKQGEQTVGTDPVDEESKIEFILDIPLEIVVELGRNRMKISDLYRIGPGSVVEFSNLAGDPLDILVNGTLIARGEVMVQGEKYGIRIVDILSRSERIRGVF